MFRFGSEPPSTDRLREERTFVLFASAHKVGPARAAAVLVAASAWGVAPTDDRPVHLDSSHAPYVSSSAPHADRCGLRLQRTRLHTPVFSVSMPYASEAVVFADFDGDGEEELLSMVDTAEYPRRRYVAAMTWTPEGCSAEWKVAPGLGDGMLVGNIDEDPLPEVILFGEHRYEQPMLKVFQWDGEGVNDTEFPLVGKLGLLADLDGDSKDELLLVRTRVRKFDASTESPSNLLVYKYQAGRFALTHKRELATGVAALTSVDLDGDGSREVVTSEISFEGDVAGRLSVYRFEPGGAVSVAFRRNGVLEPVGFLGAFRSAGATYLLAKGYRWQSLFRVWEESGAFRIAPLAAGAAALPVFAAAHLATAAYSAERGMFFQFAEDDRTRLVPVGGPRASQWSQ